MSRQMLKNVSSEELVIRFEGVDHAIPAGGIIEVESEDVARWFIIASTTRFKPGGPPQVARLAATEGPGRSDKRVEVIGLASPPPPPEPPRPTVAVAPSPETSNTRKGLSAAAQLAVEKAAIQRLGDRLADEAMKRGIEHKGVRVADIVDALHAAGFRAPTR